MRLYKASWLDVGTRSHLRHVGRRASVIAEAQSEHARKLLQVVLFAQPLGNLIISSAAAMTISFISAFWLSPCK
jgi:hypothetical protein